MVEIGVEQQVVTDWVLKKGSSHGGVPLPKDLHRHSWLGKFQSAGLPQPMQIVVTGERTASVSLSLFIVLNTELAPRLQRLHNIVESRARDKTLPGRPANSFEF